MKKKLSNKSALLYIALLFLSVPFFAQNFTWKNGTSVLDIQGSYVTLGVPAANNKPGSRDLAATWTDAAGNFWLFGGNGFNANGALGFLNDLWKYNPATNAWACMSGGTAINQVGIYGSLGVPAPGNFPGSRWGAVSFVSATGDLYLIGGYGYDINGTQGELSDIWVYSIPTGQWKWIKGTNTCYQTAVYGTQGTSAFSNAPGARSKATGWKDATGNFWMFGGYGYNGSTVGYLNDLWRYNPSNNEWTWMTGSTSLNQTGTYGTMGTAAALNTPGARSSSGGWTDANGNLWLLAGYGYASSGPADVLDDFWKYNITTGQWTWMKGSNSTTAPQGVYGSQGSFANSNMPGGRYSPVTWFDANGDLWLFGGYGFGITGSVPDNLNDLWVFHIPTNQWKWIRGSNAVAQVGSYGTLGVNSPFNMPGARGLASSWKDSSNNLWLFGGSGYNGSSNVGKLNDLWKFDNCIFPTIVVTASSNSVCAGNSATLTVTGASTYTWSGPVTGNTLVVIPSTSTTYSVFGADVNECRDTTAITITVFSLPSVSATATSPMICAFEYTNLFAGGASTYTWSTGQISSSISIGPLTTTNYTVTGSDVNGCKDYAIVTQSVSNCTGIENKLGQLNDEISIYPNPGNGEFTISTGVNEKRNLQIFDALGQRVFEQDLENLNTYIKLDLSKGVYYYEVQNQVHQSSKGKLIIN